MALGGIIAGYRALPRAAKLALLGALLLNELRGLLVVFGLISAAHGLGR